LEKKDWDKQDKHFVALNEAPFQRKLPNVKLTPGVSLIRGPRQVGKSTWMKLLLKALREKGAKCFYYTCEDLGDYRDLSELIKKVDFFFLDEITFVAECGVQLKRLLIQTQSFHFCLRVQIVMT